MRCHAVLEPRKGPEVEGASTKPTRAPMDIERSSKDDFRETSHFVGHWMMMWLTMIHPCQVQGKV